jgi:acyl carrier protein
MTAKFDEVMRTALGLDGEFDLSTAAYGRTAEWDSVAHLELIMALEDAYGIRIDGADVLETADYAQLRALLIERYGVTLDD